MSLKSKFISVLTLGAGVVVFSAAGFAQDDKAATTTTVAPEKIEKRDKGERKFGHEGFGGKHGDHGKNGRSRDVSRTQPDRRPKSSV